MLSLSLCGLLGPSLCRHSCALISSHSEWAHFYWNIEYELLEISELLDIECYISNGGRNFFLFNSTENWNYS